MSGNARWHFGSAAQEDAEPVERGLARPGERERVAEVGRSDAAQHGAADPLRMTPHVHQREPCPVRAPIQVDVLVTQRPPDGLQVLGGMGRRVEAHVRHGVEPLQALARQLPEAGRAFVGLSGVAAQRIGAARPTLVHENEVALLTGARGMRGEVRGILDRGLAGPSGEDEDRVGGGSGSGRLQHHDAQRDAAPLGRAPLLRHLQGSAQHRALHALGLAGRKGEGRERAAALRPVPAVQAARERQEEEPPRE